MKLFKLRKNAIVLTNKIIEEIREGEVRASTEDGKELIDEYFVADLYIEYILAKFQYKLLLFCYSHSKYQLTFHL